MAVDLKQVPFVEIAVALNMIYDVIDRVRTHTGVEITPENIGQYVAERKMRRDQLNSALGVTQG